VCRYNCHARRNDQVASTGKKSSTHEDCPQPMAAILTQEARHDDPDKPMGRPVPATRSGVRRRQPHRAGSTLRDCSQRLIQSPDCADQRPDRPDRSLPVHSPDAGRLAGQPQLSAVRLMPGQGAGFRSTPSRVERASLRRRGLETSGRAPASSRASTGPARRSRRRSLPTRSAGRS
jgi:hypothetical protein